LPRISSNATQYKPEAPATKHAFLSLALWAFFANHNEHPCFSQLHVGCKNGRSRGSILAAFFSQAIFWRARKPKSDVADVGSCLGQQTTVKPGGVSHDEALHGSERMAFAGV
jgi:hypothetical protein